MTDSQQNLNFRKAYALFLVKDHALNPDKFSWPIEKLSEVVALMMYALEIGNAPIGDSVKQACKLCKIKPNRKDIQIYLAGEEE